jgi:apolipoprotein N-acyltransferase
VRRTRRSFLFGSLDRTEDRSQYFNVAILITPYGTVTIYRKMRLVPVGEYLPFPESLKPLLCTRSADHVLDTVCRL